MKISIEQPNGPVTIDMCDSQFTGCLYHGDEQVWLEYATLLIGGRFSLRLRVGDFIIAPVTSTKIKKFVIMRIDYELGKNMQFCGIVKEVCDADEILQKLKAQ
jgi:hypothetical protein